MAQIEDMKPPLAPVAYFDGRFPNINQERTCYQAFKDFIICERMKGEGYPGCRYFRDVYNSVCPNHIIEKRKDEIDKLAFPE
ncbi:uncharacterized protein LOC127708284 [Mytilus californianus]|uniref:uncharacterized protein LOC127708284 n=1 Tax=Mytilus californianus TaxID=6549 RepID=UPI002246A469|nr:uncharacterized protein LOC127708284 [Mytilus californianus]